MSTFALLGVVAVAGAIGGFVAALLSEDKGFVLPTQVKNTSGTIIRPGFVGLILVGAAAAAISFALYGPLASETVFGGPDAADSGVAEDGEDFGITLAALGGAVLIGVGGSKWLSSQVDAALLREAAAAAASKDGDDGAAIQIATARPNQALRLAQAMRPRSDRVADPD